MSSLRQVQINVMLNTKMDPKHDARRQTSKQTEAIITKLKSKNQIQKSET